MNYDHECKLPATAFIGWGDNTEKLYAAEDKLAKALQAAAKETAKVLEHPEDEFWRLSMASAILGMLGNTQREAAIAASVAFLRENGLIVNNHRPVDLQGGHQREVTVFDDRVSVLFIEHGQLAKTRDTKSE